MFANNRPNFLSIIIFIYLLVCCCLKAYSQKAQQQELSPREVRRNFRAHISNANHLLNQKTVIPNDYDRANKQIHQALSLLKSYSFLRNNPSNLISLGQGYKGLGHLDSCRQLLREAIRLQPQNVYAYVILAESYIGDIRTEAWYDSASAALLEANNYFLTMPEGEAKRECIVDISNGFKQIWSFEKARDLLEQIPEHDPQYAAALVAMGECFLGDPDTVMVEKNIYNARQCFNRAYEHLQKMSVNEIINSEIDVGNFVTLGFWYTIIGEHNIAIQLADLALKIVPGYAAPFVLRARVYMKKYEDSKMSDQNWYRNAINNLEAAYSELGRADKKYKDVGLLVAVADTYNRLGDQKSAADITKRLLETFVQDPTYIANPLVMAQVFLNLMAYRNDEARAKETFNKALVFLNKSPMIRGKEDYYLALCAGFGLLGDKTKKYSTLVTTQKLRPNYALLYLYWGEHQISQGDLDGAISLFEKARYLIESTPPSGGYQLPGKELEQYIPKIYRYLVDINIRRGHLDVAREYLPKAMTRGFETGKLLLDLGLAYKVQNEFQAAKEFLEQARNYLESDKITAEQELVTLYINLAAIYRQSNQLDKTKLYLDRAVAIFNLMQNPDKTMLIHIYIDLAKLSDQRQEAVTYLENANELLLSSENPDTSLIITVNVTLGNFYEDIDNKKAKQHYELAKDFLEPRKDADKGLMSQVYYKLAKLSEQWQQAIDYFERAREIVLSLGEKDESMLSMINIHLANLYFEHGDEEQALFYFKQAESLLVPMEGQDDMLLAHVYFKLAQIYKKKLQSETAFNYFMKAMAGLESLRNNRPDDSTLLYLLTATYNELSGYFKTAGQLEIAKQYSERTEQILNQFQKPDTTVIMEFAEQSFDVLKPLADQQKKTALESLPYEVEKIQRNLLGGIGYLEQLRKRIERARKVGTLSSQQEENLDQKLSVIYESLYDQNQLLGRTELGEYYFLKCLQGNPSYEIKMRTKNFVSVDGYKIGRHIGLSSHFEAGSNIVPTENYLIESQFLRQKSSQEYTSNLRSFYRRSSLTSAILRLDGFPDIEIEFQNAYLKSAFNEQLYRFANFNVNSLNIAVRSNFILAKGNLQWQFGHRRLWVRSPDEPQKIAENRNHFFLNLQYRSLSSFLIRATGFYSHGSHLYVESQPKEWGIGLKLFQYFHGLGISGALLFQYENGTYPPSRAQTDRYVTIFQFTKNIGAKFFMTPEIKYINFKNYEQNRLVETINARSYDFSTLFKYRVQFFTWYGRTAYSTGVDMEDFDNYNMETGLIYLLSLRLPSRIGKNIYHLSNRLRLQLGYRYARYFNLDQNLSSVYFHVGFFM